jgi:hypothetical protein
MQQQSVDTPFWANDQQKYWEDIRNIIAVLDNELYTETIVDISSAQILNMGTSPIELLPAAGLNQYYDIDKVVFEYTHITTRYTLGDNNRNMNLFGNNGSYLTDIYSGILRQTANSVSIVEIGNYSSETPSSGGFQRLNDNIQLYISGGNPTLGDGTLRVKIYHKTLTFGA